MPSARETRDHQGGAAQRAGAGFARADDHLQMVRVLDQDPGLGSHLSGDALRQASSAAIAPLLRIDQGPRHF